MILQHPWNTPCRARVGFVFLCLLASSFSMVTGADLDPIGDRFEVEGIEVCLMTGGDVAVTWFESISGQESLLRIYAPDGTPRGDEIVVYQDADDSPLVPPTLCCDPGGGVRVLWGVPSTLFATNALESRLFDENGAPDGPVISVAGETPINWPVTMACQPDGFLAHWYRETTDPFDEIHYLVRRFASDGTPAGSEFRVDVPDSSREPASDLAARQDGGFVVAWAGPGSGKVTAQAYDAVDAEVGPEMTVRDLGGSEVFADIDVAVRADGTAFFVWTEDEFFFDFPRVWGRAFDPAGDPVSAAFSVDGDPTGQYTGHDVAVHRTGDLAVIWGRLIDDHILGRVFAPDGTPLQPTATLAMDLEGAGSRWRMNLTSAVTGVYVLSHYGESAQGGQTVPFVQFLDGGLLFEDGFESGDVSAWSAVVP